MNISKIEMKTFDYGGESSCLQLYYGMRVYEKGYNKPKEIDFSNPMKDGRVKSAEWIAQDVKEEEELVGFHIQKWDNASIKRFGMLTTNKTAKGAFTRWN